MDQYAFFAVLSILVAVVRYGTYFYTIYEGATTPHAFTWFLSGTVTGIGTAAQSSLDGGPSVWGLAFVSATCLFISGLACFYGERSRTRSDWMALLLGLSAIPVWRVTQSPFAALCIVAMIDLLAYWPTVRKSFNRPDSEPPISCYLAGLRYFLILLAVPQPTLQTAMYPFFLMATDWAFATYIVIRRAQLGLPLHEYARVARVN